MDSGARLPGSEFQPYHLPAVIFGKVLNFFIPYLNFLIYKMGIIIVLLCDLPHRVVKKNERITIYKAHRKVRYLVSAIYICLLNKKR